MKTIDREKLNEFKTCSNCGILATVPYNLDIRTAKDDLYIHARCIKCQHETRWKKYIKPKKQDEEKPCRKCGKKVIIMETKKKASQKLKDYYFTHYLLCTGCSTMYMDDRFKVMN